MPRMTVLLVSLFAATVAQAGVQTSDGSVIKGDLPSANVTFSQVGVNPASGHSYEFVRLSTAISWHDAVIMAENAGGYLATVTDSVEARIVTTLLSGPGDEAWLGASDEAQEGAWTWITGEPWGYTNWYPGEPNAGRDTEDYLLATSGLGGRWVDVWDNNYGLIIEHDTATRNIIFNPLNGHSYEYVKLPGDVFWHDAVIMAQNAGGYLATITDSTEAAIVTTFLSIPGNNATWLGGSDEAQEGVWAWVTGEAWDYTNWYPGEPNAAYPNQDYLEAQHVLGGRWVDVEDGCDGIIIEKDSTSPNVIINPANGHKYEFVRLSTAISWHDAVTMAENAGGYLATVTDSGEARIVTTLLSGSGDEAWLGASDDAQEGAWTWITGEPWGYTNWYPGEPNAGYPNEDYLLVTNGLGGRWVDVWDDNYGLIIESETRTLERPTLVWPLTSDHIIYDMLPTFSWTDVTGDVTYRLELSIDQNFAFLMTVDSLVAPEHQLADSLDFGTHYWWRVIATDQNGNFSVSDTADFWTWTLGDVNHTHNVSISDVMTLIDHLYISRAPIVPPRVGDVNGDCKISIVDVARLVAHMFISRVELRVGCE